MSDNPEPFWPGSREVEAVVSRAVAERLDPVRAQLTTVARALAILAERVPRPQQVTELSQRVDALASRLEEVAPDGASIASLQHTIQVGLTEVGAGSSGMKADELRLVVATAVGRTVEQAVHRLEAATSADTAHLLDKVGALEASLAADVEARQAQGDQLHKAFTTAVEEMARRFEEAADAEARPADNDELRQALGDIEAARAADATRLLERVGALETTVAVGAEGRGSQTDELRQALAVAVSHAVAKVDQARGADGERILERIDALEEPLRRDAEQRTTLSHEVVQAVDTAVERSLAPLEAARVADASRLLEQVATLAEAVTRDVQGREAQADQLRTGFTATVEQALGDIEAARTADANRVLEQVAALEGPLTRDAIARQAQLDDLRQTVASTLDQAVSRIETARSADAATLLDQIAALAAGIQAEARRRDEQAAAMLTTVDERLQALHAAGTLAAGEQEGRLLSRLEALTAVHGQALVDRIDERTAPITDLEAIPRRVAAEVQSATAAALTSQVEPLLARLLEAIDTLAHEGGRIEAMARGHAGEARAVEERVAALFTEVAERAETAVDRSRARISEGQVALGARFDSILGEMLSSVSAATERLEARLAESAEGLRAAGGHQNGALLDAVNRSGQQLSDGLTDVRAALFATGTESAARGAEADQRAESLAERLDSLRATVESIRHDPRLEALVVEQVAARDAQVSAIEAVSARIDEVGPVVARALLAEVERATRAANAAEEAVASLRPEALRTALLEGAERAADEVRAAAGRLDAATAVLADRVGEDLSSLVDSQNGVRDALAALHGVADDPSLARIEEMDRTLSGALEAVAAAVETTRAELLALTGQAIDRSVAVADEASRASSTAMDDLRASQAVLRAAVQEGAHKAELAALDIRGLRERLAPHLVALADATTRRAEADQAGFDAVLARLDQLLAASHR